MKLPTNKFKQAIKNGEPQIGLWISLCSNFAADVVATAGYDWLLLDMEHSPNEVGIVMSQLQALNSGSSSALVRPMWNDGVVVKRLLDVGSTGLLFPMVQNATEAKQAVSSTRYPPLGTRGVSASQRGNRFGRCEDYFERADDETCVIVQIESKQALDDVQEIASVDGVDGIFFGPADITADFGKLGRSNDAEVWQAIDDAAKCVREVGKPVGTLVGSADHAAKLFAKGFSFVACGSDLNLLARGADKLLADVRAKIT
jgi:4-hydroxy-2-oxoheptanedioate aldolase